MASARPEPRLVKGFRDLFAQDASLKREMIDTVRAVYERYGYMPLETPALEYVDVLGKFLPESATPAGGIFSFRNPDFAEGQGDAERWLSLRYDLTAPLARVAAQYQQELPKPFRRYQVGSVYRYEKPGPGRFREFMQFDFDAVGVPSVLADAEVCTVICDAFSALGFERGEYSVRVNDRKILTGVLESCGFANENAGSQSGTQAEPDDRGLVVLRAIDKLDRLGIKGVSELLGSGRKDESGDFTAGAGLSAKQIDVVIGYLQAGTNTTSRAEVLANLDKLVGNTATGAAGISELRQINDALNTMGYDEAMVAFDPTIVRGLAYYTGPVFEGVITKQITDSEGQKRQFGSVYGGGRYDDLVERFTGVKVPATGASIGVDRMLEAMKLIRGPRPQATAKVLVLVIDPPRMPWYLQTTQKLRRAGIPTEMYLGEGGFKAQLKYADKLGIPLAVVAGGNELDKGVVQIKDLIAGKQQGASANKDQWKAGAFAQREVPEASLVEEIKKLL